MVGLSLAIELCTAMAALAAAVADDHWLAPAVGKLLLSHLESSLRAAVIGAGGVAGAVQLAVQEARA